MSNSTENYSGLKGWIKKKMDERAERIRLEREDDEKEIYRMNRGGRGGGRGGRGRDYRRPKDAKGTFIRIIKYAVHTPWLLLVVAICVLGSTYTSLWTSYFMKPLIDDYIVPTITQVEKDFSGLAGQIFLLAGLYLLNVIFTYGESRIMNIVAQKASADLRRDLFDALQYLPVSYYDQHTNGEIMSRFTNDTESVQQMIEGTLVHLVQSVITFVSTIVLMLGMGGFKLFSFTLATIIINLIIVKQMGKKSKVLFKKQQAALGILNGYIEEMIEGVKVVKAFNYEEEAKRQFNELNDEYRENAFAANFVGQSLHPILQGVMHISYALTAVFGAMMCVNGTFTVGGLGTYLSYTRRVAQPVNSLSQEVVSFLSAVAGAERIFAVMDADPEPDDGNVTLVSAKKENGKLVEVSGNVRTGTWAWKIPQANGGFELRELRGEVDLKDVVFSYIPGKTILKGISVHANPGHKIAFVGSTGAGKTTITNLINRFYDIESGTITYDGIDIMDIKKDDLRHSLGAVLQDVNLFTGTIMENIRYGRLDATDEECIEAAKSANAHGFISRLPDGYNSPVTGNGGNLSQGQRQLLAIARAAVADPPVMILDEATSSIDTRTEMLIERGMDALMENRTVFVIAHRLSTVRNSQAIEVLEHGEIIERGNHDELLEQKGRYYLLYTGQSELD